MPVDHFFPLSVVGRINNRPSDRLDEHVSEDPLIRVLGRTRIGLPGAEVILSAHIERTLWVLVGNMPNPVTPDTFAAVIWGEEPIANWKAALRGYLPKLRKVLEACPGAPQLVRVNGGYALQGDASTIDFYRFQNALSRAQTKESLGDERRFRDEASGLWGGVPFLNSDYLPLQTLADRWVDLFEENERERTLLAVELGDAELVMGRLQTDFEADPTDVSVVEPLVGAYLSLGRISDAQNVLVRSRAVLEDRGFGTPPSFAVLEGRVLTSELEARRSDGILTELPALLRQERFLVGRQTEIDEFKRDLLSDRVAFVVLQGPAGIGKSQLAGAFAREAVRENIPVVAAWADEHSPPLQAISDLIQPWTEILGAASAESLEMLLTSLAKLSPEQRVLVVIEDLHFVDLATSKALRRLVRRGSVPGVTMLFTVRDAYRNSAVEQLLRDLQSLENARVRHLGALSVEDTFAMVQQAEKLPPAAAWTRANRLHRLSAGFPLVLDFLIAGANVELRDGMTDDSSDEEPSSLSTEPGQVRVHGQHREPREPGELYPLKPVDASAVTLSAAGRLSESDLDIVVVGALSGLEVELPVLVDAVSKSIAEVLDAVDRAHEIGLTDLRSTVTVRFRHPLIQRALWESRSAVWRCEKHKLLAAALVKRSADPFAVCQQLALALPNETTDDLLRDIFAGVEFLHEAHRWEEAFALLETVSSTIDLKPWWVTSSDLFEYYLLSGVAADGCADGELARSFFRKAKALADTDGRADWLFRVAVRSSGSSQPLDGDAERADWLRQSFDPARGLEDSGRVQALAEFVYLRSLSAVDDEVTECVAEMERLAERINDSPARAHHAHGALAASLTSNNAKLRLKTSVDARKWGDSVPPEIAMTPVLTEVYSLLQLGRRHEIVHQISDVETLVRKRQRPGDWWMVHLLRAMLAEWDGDIETADNESQMARKLAIRHDIHGGREAWGLFQIARVYRTDDRVMARRFVTDSDELTLVEQAVAAMFFARDGQLDVARRIVDRVVAALELGLLNLEWLSACLAAGEAASLSASAVTTRLIDLLVPYSGLFVSTVLWRPVVSARSIASCTCFIVRMATTVGRTNSVNGQPNRCEGRESSAGNC